MLGRYKILEEIGCGGMGRVFRAEDRVLARTVAIKILRRDGMPHRFLREARTVASLRHPGIVPVHDVGESDGVPYFVMEFVEGKSLLEWIEGDVFTRRELAELVRQAAEAVAYVHRCGVLHRDVKPENILVTPRKQAFVADFGLAREADALHRSTAGLALGTPSYMSPEQAVGGDVDERTDVWSLGATLYHAITGIPPFRGATISHTLQQVLHVDPTPPSRLCPGIDRDLDTICLKALRKEPGRRYAHARLGDSAAAVDDFTAAIRLDPSLGLAWYNRGYLLLREERFGDALRDLSKAVELLPAHPASRVFRGAARFVLGDFAGARADFDRALELDPAHLEAQLRRGEPRLASEDRGGAIEDLDRVLREAPADWPHRAAAEALRSRPPAMSPTAQKRRGRRDGLQATPTTVPGILPCRPYPFAVQDRSGPGEWPLRVPSSLHPLGGLCGLCVEFRRCRIRLHRNLPRDRGGEGFSDRAWRRVTLETMSRRYKNKETKNGEPSAEKPLRSSFVSVPEELRRLRGWDSRCPCPRGDAGCRMSDAEMAVRTANPASDIRNPQRHEVPVNAYLRSVFFVLSGQRMKSDLTPD